MDTERLVDALANRHDCPYIMDLVDDTEFGCELDDESCCRVERACEAKYPDSVTDYEHHARTLMQECWRKWFGEDDA